MFKLNARNLVRFAKKNDHHFVEGKSTDCAVGMTMRAFGLVNYAGWHCSFSHETYAKKIGLSVDQMFSLESGFEDDPYVREFKIDKRYLKMGQNIRRLAEKEKLIGSW